MFSKINPDWKNQTAIILASGTSVTKHDLDYVRELHKKNLVKVIAINANYSYADYADIVYFCDYKFYLWNSHKREFKNHPARKISICPHNLPNVERLKQGEEHGISHSGDTLNTGRNSGYQSINLAYLLGASRIVLVGLDMQTGEMGKTHHHTAHEQPTDPTVYDRIMKDDPFETIAPELKKKGVEVINCSINSAITCFKKLSLVEVFSA